MDENEQHTQLTRVCQNLGADEAQARIMASQLIKRSTQLARERNISEIEAMQYLLSLVKSGREGDTTPKFPPNGGSSGTKT